MISTNLKAMKDSLGMSNLELSQRSGVPLPVISRLMTSKTDDVSFMTVCRLVKAMGGSIDEFAWEYLRNPD